MNRPEDEALKARIHDRTRALLQAGAALCRRHRARVPVPLIRFDLRGQAAGQVRWQRHGIAEVRYNLDIARRQPADFLAQTVPHEVAHLLTFACHGRTAPHGREWRTVMRHLGVSEPQRCHHYPVDEAAVRRQRRWSYRCDCRQHELSTTRHNRVRRGLTEYRCRHCDAPLRWQAGPADCPAQ